MKYHAECDEPEEQMQPQPPLDGPRLSGHATGVAGAAWPAKGQGGGGGGRQF